MQSLIITGKNIEKIQEEINGILKKESVDSIDTNISTFEKSVGIGDIRTIQKSLYLKPIKSKTKAIIIMAPNGLTTESQNSLLKILEEPPDNTLIILTTENKHDLLQTIISRCKIIETKEDLIRNVEKISKYLSLLDSLEKAGVGERLKFAQDFGKTREEADKFLQDLILAAREKLLENTQNSNYLETLKKLQKVHTIIKTTNVSPRLSLENLFLTI